MKRYYDWHMSQVPDFWTSYYQDPHLIEFLAFVNSLYASESGGYPLLQAYDICDIDPHLPGQILVWEPLELINYTTNIADDFPYYYSIPNKWLSIPNVVDKYANPNVSYQSNIDYRFDRGRLAFLRPVTPATYLVPKGTITGLRLHDYVGKAFGYPRYDSPQYRDNIMPMLNLHYNGPTIHSVNAVANVLIGHPVAKYGEGEKLKKIDQGYTYTDKYTYNTGIAGINPNLYSVINKYDPLTKAITLYTYRTDGNWWEGVVPDLFNKYSEVLLTPETKNTLMNTFLKYFVAYIRLNASEVDIDLYNFQNDILQVLYDGSPIRTDYIFSLSSIVTSFNIPDVDEIRVDLKIGTPNIWTGSYDYPEASEYWLYAPKYVTPRISATANWEVGNNRWHILAEENTYDEFWSTVDEVKSYVEPNYDRTWWKETGAPVLESEFSRTTDYLTFTPNYDSGAVSIISTDYITDIPNYSSSGELTIQAVKVYALTDLSTWTKSGVHTGISGIITNQNSTGTLVSPQINFGNIPKNVSITLTATTPVGTSITVSPGASLTGVTGLQAFTFTLSATGDFWPSLSEVIISVSV